MRRTTARIAAMSLVLALVLQTAAFSAADTKTLQNAADRTAKYLTEAVTAPQVGSIGGEWLILGLARGACAVPETYYAEYLSRVVSYVKSCKGVLHSRKYTEYSRVILTLTALGQDPTNVGGYDLLAPLADFSRTAWQGVNGIAWAIIALDCGNYTLPVNKASGVQATRAMYVHELLARQNADGGWALAGTVSDPDTTAMALTALARYRTEEKAAASIEQGLAFLSITQDEKGGYHQANGAETVESSAQVLTALCELGVGPEDSRFVKNDRSVLDHLLSLQLPCGGFPHSDAESSVNLMATEQACYAMEAVLRLREGKNSLFDMRDASAVLSGVTEAGKGLPGRDPAVHVPEAVNAGVSFPDIVTAECRVAVEALAARGIVSGMGDGTFCLPCWKSINYIRRTGCRLCLTCRSKRKF